MSYAEDNGHDEYWRGEPLPVTCKYCGQDDLYWNKVPGSDGSKSKWRLFDRTGVNMHSCDRTAAQHEEARGEARVTLKDAAKEIVVKVPCAGCGGVVELVVRRALGC